MHSYGSGSWFPVAIALVACAAPDLPSEYEEQLTVGYLAVTSRIGLSEEGVACLELYRINQTTRDVTRYDPPASVIRSVGRELGKVVPASDCAIDSSRGALYQHAVERRTKRPAWLVAIHEPLTREGDTVFAAARQWCGMMCGGWGDLRIWAVNGKWQGSYDQTLVQ